MTRRRRFTLACAALLLPFLAAAAIFLSIRPPLLEDVSFSRAVFDRHGALLRLTLAEDQSYRLFTPLGDMSPQLKEAVLLHEDRYFYSHAGINPAALVRAFIKTYVTGGRRLGASTLSMQLARIKYRINSHSIPGKFWQMARALQFEAHYSKDALFEAYLNLAPYGYNINGAGAASYIYFHAQPKNLSLPEALTLAVLPQSPARRSPAAGAAVPQPLLDARNRLFARWLAAHPEDAVQKVFFALPLVSYGIKDLPFEAPHLTRDLLARSARGQISATIDLDMQHLLERIVRQYVSDRHASGLENASVILVDTRTMEVESLIGSANFTDAGIDGQVDGTRARRSPGSTLKPFIYALALDQGLIHPATILADAPVSYGSYTPDNFERDFRGPVPARSALRLSRNIPAIRLAAQLKSPDLYDFLRQSGIGGLKEKKNYGLSLVLGGAEVTPRELAALYATLANDGVLRPLRYEIASEQSGARGQPLLTPEASFTTLDMLADTPRPYAVREPLKLYWKTGTSNGFHDAWTAGVFGHYALVVWLGSFSGKANPSLVGLHAAAPLFLALAEAVQGKDPQREIIAAKAPNLRIRKLEVCATTGDLALENCPVAGSAWFIPGVSPIARSAVYRDVLVDINSGLRACRESPATVHRTFEVWPSDLAQTLRTAGIEKPALPRYEAGCTAEGQTGQQPVILSPQPKVEYHARIDDKAEAIAFSASADGDVTSLSWFIDNLYFGSATPGTALYWPAVAGRHNVRVVDDQGRAGTTTIHVSLAQ